METKHPLILTGKEQMRRWSRIVRSQGKTVGLVPTMGYVHDGHLSLVREAHKHADLIVVSIYVNPGQFAPSEDLTTYPSDFPGDINKLESVPGGVDVVFHPHNLYDYGNGGGGEGEKGGEAAASSCLEEWGLGHETWVRVEKLEMGMCGKSRPIFFRGVVTVVAKLFNIVEPDVAVFGKKDYQQWRIIQRLASSINQSLSKAKYAAEKGIVNCEVLKNSVIQAIHEVGGRIDYAEIVEQENLEAVEEIKGAVVFCVAAWFGKVRLIDNIEINV
ncbi:pantoate--beta-alanine ligase (AMP-forming) [Sarracenia purpurea var. burkii]